LASLEENNINNSKEYANEYINNLIQLDNVLDLLQHLLSYNPSDRFTSTTCKKKIDYIIKKCNQEHRGGSKIETLDTKLQATHKKPLLKLMPESEVKILKKPNIMLSEYVEKKLCDEYDDDVSNKKIVIGKLSLYENLKDNKIEIKLK
jgi:serine/threonine protein kinase